jgi:hypothetical protein
MKKMYCPDCGGEIMITRVAPDYSWTIEEHSLTRADNLINDGPELLFHCSNDREHDIYPLTNSQVIRSEFDNWMNEVEEFYKENVIPWL